MRTIRKLRKEAHAADKNYAVAFELFRVAELRRQEALSAAIRAYEEVETAIEVRRKDLAAMPEAERLRALTHRELGSLTRHRMKNFAPAPTPHRLRSDVAAERLGWVVYPPSIGDIDAERTRRRAEKKAAWDFEKARKLGQQAERTLSWQDVNAPALTGFFPGPNVSGGLVTNSEGVWPTDFKLNGGELTVYMGGRKIVVRP